MDLYKTLEAIPELEWFYKEAIRFSHFHEQLHAPFLREATREIVLKSNIPGGDDITIPEGTHTSIEREAALSDPKYWDDSYTFNIDRYLKLLTV